MVNNKTIDKTWDEKADAYNEIALFLEEKGMNEEDLFQCMRLVKDYSEKEVNFMINDYKNKTNNILYGISSDI